MELLRKCTSIFSPVLIAILLYTTIPISPVVASIVSTDQLLDAQAAADSRGKVSSFLAREDVRRHMESMGVDPSQVDNRLAALSDSEVRYLAGQIDQMPAGQGVVGILLTVAIVLFIVLIITDLIGVTDVFPFINSQSERKR
jgi:hypothetical protein